MSSFLQQLKSGGFEIDNQKGADATGMIVRRVERRFVGEPADKLGLQLGDDAEIREVTKGSLAAKANVPIHFIIFDVNGHFVESRSDFLDIVSTSQSLNLVIKMQSVSAMSELIAMTIRDDENREANQSGDGPSAPRLDYDELLRTTPRYSFLSVSHPLFRRYNQRLQEKREAVALVRRRTQENEEQLRRERSEMIRREMEAAAEEERKKKQLEEEKLAAEKARAAAATAAAAAAAEATAQESFIKVVKDESTFAAASTPEKTVEVEPAKEVQIESEPTPPPPPAGNQQPTDEGENRSNDAALAAELLAVLGVPPAPAPAANKSVLGVGNPGKSGTVTCETLPTEEYTLSSGERVVCNLKKRTGPTPNPPPGIPPRAKAVTITDTNKAGAENKSLKRQRGEMS